MMTEVSPDQPEVVSAGPDVVQQLQDAAQTDVTKSNNGSPRKGPPTPGKMPSPSKTPPPAASLVASSSLSASPQGSGSPVPTPQMYTPFTSPTQMYPTPSPQSVPIRTGSGLVNQSPVSSTVPYSYSLAPGALQTPYEASASIQMDDIGSPLTPQAMNSGGSGLFGWGKGFMSKVVEKTKSSVESMITTLDPQMKEVIYSGGDLTVVVASSKESKISPVRDAFLSAFGRATVLGRDCQSHTAPQPVGFTVGCKGAEDRAHSLRSSGACTGGEVVVSIEGFIVEILPDRWFEMSCLSLHDQANNIQLQTFSQPTPLPPHIIDYMQDSTPPDYPLRWSGLAVTVGEAMERLEANVERTGWHESLTGVTRRETLAMAARTLVGLYSHRLNLVAHGNT